MKDRLKFIDIAKGIAIICIILGHLREPNINRVVYTFHVPIFFFITGYFVNSKLDIMSFIKVKIRKLLVPYFVTCLVIIVLGTIQGWFEGNWFVTYRMWAFAAFYGAGDVYTEPFYIPAIGALWFLWATFWGSCFLRVSFKFNSYMRIGFIGVLFVIGYYSRSICWFPFSIQAGMCATLFMYLGHLLRDNEEIISRISNELRIFGCIMAIVTWGAFIKDFQSFWLVHCDMGRGIVDIFGCICACSVVIMISKVIDRKAKIVGDFFAYFGKYSLLVLCVHIVELNLLPWWDIANRWVYMGMPQNCKLLFIVTGKILLDLTSVYVLSKISFVRKLYGFDN